MTYNKSMKNTVIQIRIDKETKVAAEKVITDMGLNFSSAIQMFLRQVVQKQEIPFTIESRGYNQKTLDAFDESLESGDLETFESIDDFIKDFNDNK